MKITELISRLKDVKRIHGDLDVCQCDSETGDPASLKSMHLVYPLDSQGCYDRKKPPIGVMVVR
jgi:hypothetical protein